MEKVTVIGAGLAGAEAAWQIAERGITVDLYEMRPGKQTAAHQTGNFAELICSNSLRADGLTNAVGLLKEEMRQLNSLILQCAEKKKVPAGVALAVERDGFPALVTEMLTNHPLVHIYREEVTEIPKDGIVIVASGPLTEGALAADIQRIVGADYLHFHDAVAPVVEADSINMDIAFRGSRYDKGETTAGDYINCPFTREQYDIFYENLVSAQLHPLHDFEEEKVFEGCMPIEVMAKRGPQTMLYGPLKPVGLTDPHTGMQPYAVVQLRQDNGAASQYNLVGFQTRLTWGEQKRVFRLIPGLEQAEFARFGVMHRNTYLNSPCCLKADLSLKNHENIFFAGQITGVEGYIESAAMGLLAGLNANRAIQQQPLLTFPLETALGSLANYITIPTANFQPSNITFGMMPPMLAANGKKIRNKQEKALLISERSLAALRKFCTETGIEAGE
ncbi:MAG: methylenetetrahydrofolate--tRNA-(uracil(54)-C(5))-methyltransferase (FADH(2)-oxidizing) TrmFO [Peptococcaceae bacterium]|nr:methylenetetrahydrofolate--tRNA-(uracil(54)-C(5))-methyltransferase (FADH(2)-oxidizing) TrmFO [Peptococcaceae bacterium]